MGGDQSLTFIFLPFLQTTAKLPAVQVGQSYFITRKGGVTPHKNHLCPESRLKISSSCFGGLWHLLRTSVSSSRMTEGQSCKVSSFETCAAMSVSGLGIIAVITDCPPNSSFICWITWDWWHVYAGAILPQAVSEASGLQLLFPVLPSETEAFSLACYKLILWTNQKNL